jgi:PilZ domain
MTDDAREQRRFPRVPSEKAVLVKRIGDEASEALAKTRTVGAGGCMFVHHEPLGVGSAVELLISLPGRVVKARGRVVWENLEGAGRVEVGVEFLDVSAKDRRALDAAVAAVSPVGS